jgi:hypothetical protein
MVNVLDESGNVIGRVKYNNNLDYWDGRNWINGGPGRHKGITKLKDGRYVIIHGTEWIGEDDFARVVSPEVALQEILKSGNDELLNKKRFSELKELLESTIVQEEEEEAEYLL